jgi:hypothetical protein
MFNQARRWNVPGVTENPARGFKIVPDVCRERFLSPKETKLLMQALDEDEKQKRGCRHQATRAHRCAPQ